MKYSLYNNDFRVSKRYQTAKGRNFEGLKIDMTILTCLN